MSGALKCDGCGKFAAATTEKTRIGGQVTLPLGWLRIFIEDRNRDEGPTGGGNFAVNSNFAEVCSRACGATWLAGHES